MWFQIIFLSSNNIQFPMFNKVVTKFLDYNGDNRFPYNFDDLLECIREWLPDEEADKLHKYIF